MRAERNPSSTRPRAVFLLLTLLLYVGCKRDKLILEQARVALPADGRVHLLVEVRRESGDALAASDLQLQTEPPVQAPAWRSEQDGPRRAQVFLQTPVTPGREVLSLRWHGQRDTIPVRFVADDRDSYGDGTPDFLRLHSVEDRHAFRNWFTGIAEQEAERPAGSLPAEIDDCAALLRFAYRQALVEHDAHWLMEQSFPVHLLSLPSVHQYHYPRTPLGAGLFRVKAGPFVWGDLRNGSFAQFADARALMRWNTHFISRDPRDALPGDLLFFRQLEQDSPYHSMIVTGERADWLIYDTGPIGKAKGEIRRVALEDLLRYPDARWRPVRGNSNFLGVYRWNILREGD